MANVQIAIIDQENTQIALSAPSETQVNIAVPGVQGPIGLTGDVAIAQDGTAATPGIRFQNDTNTGIYRPGADQLAISTGGTGRLFVAANGDVNLLDNGLYLIKTGLGNGQITFDGSTYSIVSNSSSAPLVFGTASQERLRITSAGLVGIGSSSPTAPLTVVAGSSNTDIAVFNGSTGTDRGLKISTSVNFNSDAAVILDAQEATYGALLLRTRGTNALFIDSSQRVGIGTSSPAAVQHNYSVNQELLRLETTNATGAYMSISGPSGTGLLLGTGASLSSGTATDGAIRSPNSILFASGGGTERLRITSAGLVGIGTSSPTTSLQIGDATGLRQAYISGDGYDLLLGASGGAAFGFASKAASTVFNNTSVPLVIGTLQSQPVVFGSANFERARIDSSGRLLVGTSSASAAGTLTPRLQVQGTDAATSLLIQRDIASDAPPYIVLAKTRAGAGNVGLVVNNDSLGRLVFAGGDGVDVASVGAEIGAFVDGTSSANDLPTRLVFSTTPDGSSGPTERMRINQQGSVRIGGTGDPGAIHIIDKPGVAIGTQVLTIQGSDESVRVYNASSFANPNGAAMVMWVRANNTTSRSINAAGTINASGTDYAEYMTKAGNFVLAKGDVCGIDANGLLTNIYTNSVSFVVKSTNPSYVGGDTWGCGFDADSLELEAERQKVDRIAFAGQVPVNVTSAAPGQYIVPFVTEDGGITGIAKDEADLTLAEYMRAVGKVIAIEDDGRARIIVKVA